MNYKLRSTIIINYLIAKNDLDNMSNSIRTIDNGYNLKYLDNLIKEEIILPDTTKDMFLCGDETPIFFVDYYWHIELIYCNLNTCEVFNKKINRSEYFKYKSIEDNYLHNDFKK